MTFWNSRRLNPLRLAAFALLTALTATLVLLGTSELCACGPSSVSSKTSDSSVAEPLSLTLSGPKICDVEPGGRYTIGGRDARGRIYSTHLGWNSATEVNVTWQVTGGQGPYKLTIDGETRDNLADFLGDFTGASGSGWVDCALEHGEAFYIGEASDEGIDLTDPNNFIGYHPDRVYQEQPVIDSGLKIISATVTDANGDTATTSIDVYAILLRAGAYELLEGGKTYRVFGELLTIPEGINLEIGGVVQALGGPTFYDLYVHGPDQPRLIALGLGTNQEIHRYDTNIAAAQSGSSSDTNLSDFLDELVASAGKLPPPASDDTP